MQTKESLLEVDRLFHKWKLHNMKVERAFPKKNLLRMILMGLVRYGSMTTVARLGLGVPNFIRIKQEENRSNIRSLPLGCGYCHR
jgi:hypothetical protein